jgi:hypothetical protein
MKTLVTLTLSFLFLSSIAQTSLCGTSIQNFKETSIEELGNEFKRLKAYNNPYCDTTNSDLYKLMNQLAFEHKKAKSKPDGVIVSMGKPYFRGTMTEYEDLTLKVKHKGGKIENTLPPLFKIPAGRYYMVYLWRKKDYLVYAFTDNKCVGYSWWEMGDYELELGLDEIKLLSEEDWNMNVAAGKHGITGRVVDMKTFRHGQGSLEVGLYNKSREKLDSTSTNEDGRFEFRDVDPGDYNVRMEGDREDKYSEVVVVDDLNVPFMYANSIEAGADGFFKFKKLSPAMVEMKRMEARDAPMILPFNLAEMDPGNSLVLSTVAFGSGSSILLSGSFSELNRLTSALKDNSSVNIEITGHTDNTGNASANQALSEKRAKSVQEYLISKGISADRITFKGMGHVAPMFLILLKKTGVKIGVSNFRLLNSGIFWCVQLLYSLLMFLVALNI